jgi:hypothetical protein
MSVDEEVSSGGAAAEVVISSGRKIAVGGDWWDIRDDGRPAEFVEVITECRQRNGVVFLAFASMIIDANNTGLVSIASRLRMDLANAQHLRNMLDNIITDALKPSDKTNAN